MPDRLIRDELLDSERWLALPNDGDRLAFVGLLLRCDDFGNLEGGPRRLFRFLYHFTQIKTEEAAATSLLHLADADLLRRYEVEKRELYHIPRFRPHRQYLVRKVPASPWDADRAVGKNRRVIEQGLAKEQSLKEPLANNVATISQALGIGLPEGVGVGVGVNPPGASARVANSVPPALTAKANSGGDLKGNKPKGYTPVPLVTDVPGLEKHARDMGINPEKFHSYELLRTHLITEGQRRRAEAKGVR